MAYAGVSNLGRHPFGIVALLLFVLLAAHGVYFGGKAALADALTLETRSNLDKSGALGAPQQWEQYRNKLIEGVKWTPDNPDLFERLGVLHLERALVYPRAAGAKNDVRHALEYYRRAASLRPMSPYAWCNVALILHKLDTDSAAMWSGFDQAMAYGKNEAGVQTILAEIGYARHAGLLPTRRVALIQVFERSSAPLRTALLAIARKNAVDPLKL